MAIASLVCSIVSLFSCGIGSILAVVFGHIAQSQMKRTGEKGSGLALAGLIIGYLGIAVIAIYLIVIVSLAASGNID